MKGIGSRQISILTRASAPTDACIVSGSLIVSDVVPVPESAPATLDERRGWLEAVLPPMNPIGQAPIGENEVRVARAWSLLEAAWSHLQVENWWTG